MQLDDLQIIWLGDFNRHHPMWEDECNTHLLSKAHLDNAQPLLNLLTTFDFHMLLPLAIPTLEAANTKNHTHPDNIFASLELAGTLVHCCTAPELQPPCTDHYPIVTKLQVNLPHAPTGTFCNFCCINWPAFHKALAIRLEDIPLPKGNFDSVDTFNDTLQQVMSALSHTINKEVLETKLPPFAKHWYSKELDNL